MRTGRCPLVEVHRWADRNDGAWILVEPAYHHLTGRACGVTIGLAHHRLTVRPVRSTPRR